MPTNPRRDTTSSIQLRGEASTPDPNSGLSSPELYKMLRDLQDNLTATELELRDTKRKLADLENEEPPQKTSRRRLDDEESIDKDYVERVRRNTRKFTVMYMLWIRDPAGTFRADINPEWRPIDRFDTASSKDLRSRIQGQLHDLVDAFGEGDDVVSRRQDWFESIFKETSSQQRSNMASRLRRVGQTIFGCTAQDLASSAGRSTKFSELIGLQPYRDRFEAPLLYSEFRGKFDRDTVFLNPKLMKVLSAIIRGPRSVETADGEIMTSVRGETSCSLWSLNGVTPGAIATAAVLARWTLSADDELHPRGLQTKNDWQADFEEYLKYLTEGLIKSKRSVREIMRRWTTTLFPDAIVTEASSTGAGSSAAFRDLNDDDEDVGSDAGSPHAADDDADTTAA